MYAFVKFVQPGRHDSTEIGVWDPGKMGSGVPGTLWGREMTSPACKCIRTFRGVDRFARGRCRWFSTYRQSYFDEHTSKTERTRLFGVLLEVGGRQSTFYLRNGSRCIGNFYVGQEREFGGRGIFGSRARHSTHGKYEQYQKVRQKIGRRTAQGYSHR